MLSPFPRTGMNIWTDEGISPYIILFLPPPPGMIGSWVSLRAIAWQSDTKCHSEPSPESKQRNSEESQSDRFPFALGYGSHTRDYRIKMGCFLAPFYFHFSHTALEIILLATTFRFIIAMMITFSKLKGVMELNQIYYVLD